MRSRAFGLLVCVVVSAGMARAQGACDQKCSAIRSIMAAAPNGFLALRGKTLPNYGRPVSFWEGTQRVPGLDADTLGSSTACVVTSNPAASTLYQCSTKTPPGSEQPLYDQIRKAILDAAPALCWNTLGDGVYVMSGPGCGGYKTAVTVQRMSFASIITLSVDAGDFSQATHPGTLTVYAPADAQVELVSDPYANEKRSGVTDASGTLVLKDVRFGRYNVTVTPISRKPFTAMVDVEQEPVSLKAETEAAPLSEEEVSKMLRDGVGNEHLETLVERYGVTFSYSSDVEKRLRAVGANDALLLAIARSKK